MKAIVTIEVDLTQWGLNPEDKNSEIAKEIKEQINEGKLKYQIAGKITAVEIYNRPDKNG